MAIERELDSLGWNLLSCGDEEILSKAQIRLSQLLSQTNVQIVLQKTVDTLRQPKPSKPMMNRVENCVKFVFESSTSHSRITQLRQLDANTLIFCGLSYTSHKLLSLRADEFDYLTTSAKQFLDLKNYSGLAYCDDVSRAVHCEVDPDDHEAYSTFIKCKFQVFVIY